MTLSRQQLQALHKMLSLTRSQELTCDQCLKKMAQFADNALAGNAVPDDLADVEHHLALCGECEQEFRALMEALKPES